MRVRNFMAAAVFMASGAAFAAGDSELEHVSINVHDTASLQRGATLFVNYCMGCHSAQYMRYKRLAEDLDISEEQVEEFLILGDQDLSDYMLSAMDADQSEDWFGIAPPDLTLTARSRGTDWVYSFLKGFYMTDTGWNNTVLENASMPHVLWELQGIQRPVTESHTDANGQTSSEIVGLELDQPGQLTPEEYDAHVRDLVNFMAYAAEPAAIKRERMGIWVLLFLLVFTGLAYLLYHDYWKDVK